jgi:phage baseplate assembly protein W
MSTYGDLTFNTISNTSTVKGLQYPIDTANTGGMFSRSFNERAIRDGLLQLLLTQRGERPMRLDYGTNLRTACFEPLDGALLESLRKSILSAISKYEPRIVVRDFEIKSDDSNSRIFLKMVFSIKNNIFYTDQIALTVDSQGVQLNG